MNLPEIAPEIREILEEIVADPRSSIRLVPRRPLASWFDSGETVRARDISTTTAERHLIEAHREALAQVLYEASVIAYWKRPVLAHRPLGADGRPIDPTRAEPAWHHRASRRLQAAAAGGDGVELLRECLQGIRATHGVDLAQASLSLAPRDKTRAYLAACLPPEMPRAAIALYQRLISGRKPDALMPYLLLNLGARFCSVDSYGEARDAYRKAASLDCEVIGRVYSFNLSCFLDDESSSSDEIGELSKVARLDDVRLFEAKEIIKSWANTRETDEIIRARRVAIRSSVRAPELGALLCEAYES